MSTTKFSRQREAIYNYLCSTKEHPTADTVYNKIREKFPKISLGTVYRNLNLLVEQGTAQKVTCGDGSEHFDADTSLHYHFICKGCHSVLDLEMESIEHINTIANSNFAGNITGHITYFYGLCPCCSDR